MQWAEISTVGDHQLPVLRISGFGAHRVLAGEIGLHVLESEQGASRFAARVSVVATPLGDMPEAQRRNAIAKALDARLKSNNMRRRYRREPDPLVRNASGSWRSPQLDIVMGGAFDLLDAGRN